jgi:mono/diheme cytochrome c family protein
MGGIIREQRFAGGPNPTGEGSIPNITQHENALAKWSEADFENLLATGATPGGDSVGGDMRLVVRNTAQLPSDDRKAMAHYLKSLPPKAGPQK